MRGEIYTVSEAARAMSLPRATVAGYLESGRVPGVRTLGGELCVPYASIAPLTSRWRREVLEPLAEIEAEIEAGDEVRATDLLRAISQWVDEAVRRNALPKGTLRLVLAGALEVGIPRATAVGIIDAARSRRREAA